MASDSMAETECGQPDSQGRGAEIESAVDVSNRYSTRQVTSWMLLRRFRWNLTLAIAWLARSIFGAKETDRVGILMYHRTAMARNQGPVPTWNVAPERFRQQLTGLLQKGYRPLSLRSIIQMHRANKQAPNKSFVVTFDDGYENVFLNAYPILVELQVPATIFLATKYVDSECPFPFDDWQFAGSPEVSAASWRPLSKAQCQAMLESGLIDLGSHTHGHENFLGRPRAFADDLTRSMQFLSDEMDVKERLFAYPFGVVDSSLAAVCEKSDVCCALGTTPYPVELFTSPLTWGRLDASQCGSPWQLAIRLDGWHRTIEEAWKRMIRWLSSSSLIAIMDQAIVSGGSFVAAFLLGRSSPAELAMYYLAVQCLWLFRSLQNHLVILPMKVLAPRVEDNARHGDGGLFDGFRALNRNLAIVSAIVGLCAWFFFVWIRPNPELTSVFLLLSLVTPLYLLREFVRQRAFARLQPLRALLVDAITIATQVAGMLAIAAYRPLNAVVAFAWIAAANLLGLIERNPSMPNITGISVDKFEVAGPNWQVAWNFGKWNLATDALTSLMILSLSWIVKSQKGLDETGLLAAAVIPVSLASVVVNGFLNIQIPKATHAWNREGPLGLRREMAKLGCVLAGAYGLLAAGTILLGQLLFQGFYGQGYERSVVIAAASLTSSLLGTLGFVAGTGLALLRQGRINFCTEILQFTIAIGSACWLVERWGALAVPLATSIAVLVGGPIRYWQFSKRLQSGSELVP